MLEPASVDPDFRALFERASGCCLALAADLTILAVSDGYARAAMISRAGLLGRSIFDLMPDDPQDPVAGETEALRHSLARVLTLKRPDTMAPMRRAAPRPIGAGGGFEERWWSAVNTPVIDSEGEVRWIVHNLVDVTELVGLSAEATRRETLIAEQQRAADRLHATNQLLARRLDELGHRQAAHDQAMAQRAAADKLAAMGALAGSIAHDINNLFGIIRGNLEMLCEEVAQDAPALELAQQAEAAVARGVALADRLLAFGRRQPQHGMRLEPANLLAALARRLARELEPDIQVTLDLAPALWPVMADAAQLEAAIGQLVANARDAMELGGRLIVGARNLHLDADYVGEHPGARPGDHVLIEVSDTGSGMTREVARRAFEPFFTTKERGIGAGLGLSAVLGFATQSGGHAEIASEVGVGTTVRLYLPRHGVDTMSSETVAAPAAKADAGGSETVLVVEDDAAMRRVVLRQLYELGYRVLEAERPAAALRLLETESIDLLFTDIVTPGSIDGIALARTAAARWPTLKILLTSGFPQARSDQRVEINGFRLLSKPYRREELARTLREVLDGAGPGALTAD